MGYDVAMQTLGGRGARPDGAMRYRIDVHTGRRIGILPATCKRGEHSLTEVGYQATEHDGVLHVTCRACRAVPKPDHSWHLTTTPPAPDAAELDDSTYANIRPHFAERAVRAADPWP